MNAPPRAPVYIHANALIIGNAGVLIRGPSRAGKSALTLELIAQAQAEGRFARLVGDDRVSVEDRCGRVIARPHPRIAGMIEKRGVGILKTPFEDECIVALVVDLSARDAGDADAPFAQIANIRLPLLNENFVRAGCAERIFAYIQTITTI